MLNNLQQKKKVSSNGLFFSINLIQTLSDEDPGIVQDFKIFCVVIPQNVSS